MAGRGRRELRDLADAVRLRPLEEVATFLGYVRDPADRSRWRRDGSVLSVTGMKYFDHLRGQGGGGAIDLVVHPFCKRPRERPLGAVALSDFRTKGRLREACLVVGNMECVSKGANEQRGDAT